ncbi:MAG: hypothetical protein ACRCX4_09900 [Bacteroidales bacterium]
MIFRYISINSPDRSPVRAVFSSCKDDNDKLRTGVVYENDALKLSLNGKELSAKKAVVSYLSSNEAQITLDNAIVGYNNIIFTVATSEKDGTTSLNGAMTLDDAEYNVTGNVTSSDVLTLNVSQKMVSAVVGKWYLQYSQYEEEIFPGFPEFGTDIKTEPCMIAKLQTDKQIVKFMNQELRPVQVETFLQGILGGYVKSLDWINFDEKGNVSLQFDLDAQTPDVVFPDGQILKEGDLKFFTKKDKIYLAVNGALIDLLKPMLEGKIDFSKLPLEETAGYYAMPLLYSQKDLKPATALAQGKNINMYVDKAMMQPMIGMMVSLIPDDMVVAGLPIKSLMQEMNVIMTDAKSFDLGLILAQEPAPAE